MAEYGLEADGAELVARYLDNPTLLIVGFGRLYPAVYGVYQITAGEHSPEAVGFDFTNGRSFPYGYEVEVD